MHDKRTGSDYEGKDSEDNANGKDSHSQTHHPLLFCKCRSDIAQLSGP